MNQNTCVSIVPLWNWNSVEITFCAESASCLNRTFMELKYHNKQKDSPSPEGLNRTFMELKSGSHNDAISKGVSQSYLYGIEICVRWPCCDSRRVSIVPLWNWNYRTWHDCRNFWKSQSYLYGIEMLSMSWVKRIWLVSIVPLWNWNKFTSH